MDSLKDQEAIVGIGETVYNRESRRTELSMAVEAAKNAIADAGLETQEIDRMVKFTADSTPQEELAACLGIPCLRYYGEPGPLGGAVVVTMDRDRRTAASIALGGLVPAPMRAWSVEQALTGQTLTVENFLAACDNVANDLGEDVIGDIYASAEYRRAMASVEISHALCHITGQAHHGNRAEMPVTDGC